jgi:hypothetical protein
MSNRNGFKRGEGAAELYLRQEQRYNRMSSKPT